MQRGIAIDKSCYQRLFYNKHYGFGKWIYADIFFDEIQQISHMQDVV